MKPWTQVSCYLALANNVYPVILREHVLPCQPVSQLETLLLGYPGRDRLPKIEGQLDWKWG
ncbi:unnamed protein product [Schistosoma curassoni]|uniref:GST N-terminal domain-containing protein n=1 Tax=Schistosoma curassoni TaxID=6186 RepID=A0A183JWB8_9TREM|nr:unnamed protein product [Schistosoma curassoni]